MFLKSSYWSHLSSRWFGSAITWPCQSLITFAMAWNAFLHPLISVYKPNFFFNVTNFNFLDLFGWKLFLLLFQTFICAFCARYFLALKKLLNSQQRSWASKQEFSLFFFFTLWLIDPFPLLTQALSIPWLIAFQRLSNSIFPNDNYNNIILKFLRVQELNKNKITKER